LSATAPDFVPAEARLVSAPAPADASSAAGRADRKVDEAARAAQKEDKNERKAQAEADKDAADLLFLREQMAGRMTRMGDDPAAVAELSAARRRVGIAEREAAATNTELKDAERSESRRLNEYFEARVKAASMGVAVDGRPQAAAPRLMSQAELLPGDVILVRGVKPLSKAIRIAETLSYGERARYSHAAVYVGGGMVAEMLGEGYVPHTVAACIEGATHADVYRWPNLGQPQRNLIAEKAKTFGGTRYAESQIFVLGLAAGGGPAAAAALVADLRSGGAREMICSELVARSYHHAGLPADLGGMWSVRFWTSLAPLLTSDDRRHDYTTPNSLAFGGIFVQEGRLK
ncbi:MAG TPA: hypothetical protein VF508_07010, partial [Pyrinomonadaceae bacterium]